MAGSPDETDGIVTPEAVVLRFPEAGIASRALAYVIDALVMAGLVFLLFFLLVGIAFSGEGTAALIVAVVGLFLILFGYRIVLELLWDGRTVGKRALGLRVITVEGAPVRFSHVAIRSFLDLIDIFMTAGGAGLVAMLSSRRNQRIGDLAAGTIVVHAPKKQADRVPLLFRPFAGWEDFTSSLDVSHLSGPQYGVVRQFLDRVGQLTPTARYGHAAALAEHTAAVIGTPVPERAHPEMYLVAVVAAYQARSAAPALAPGAALPPPVVGPSPLPPPTGWRTGTPVA